MRPIYFLICLLLLVLNTWRCSDEGKKDVFGQGAVSTERRPLTRFNTLTLNLQGNVHIVRDTINYLEITAQPNLIRNISQTIQDRALTVRQLAAVDGEELVTIVIHTDEELQLLDSRMTGSVLCTDTLTTPKLEVLHKGSGTMLLYIDTPTLRITHSGSGEVKLLGQSDNFTTVLEKQAKGEISAFGLKGEIVTATLDGTGEIHLYATETLKATLNGSGAIRYRGAAEVSSTITGAGKIIKVD